MRLDELRNVIIIVAALLALLLWVGSEMFYSAKAGVRLEEKLLHMDDKLDTILLYVKEKE